MVFHKERDNERPPLSCILPHLYLGAETDVTQDSLSARGISYVLSVSRCSPQPTFLPKSQYLRIPIDDSLRDDLLPWIPQALRFIDGAMSLGCSVLVHCAAGISRSPALAVAYIMYRLGMDLDHAYRFVKERRPSISPNFNFLGQLQLFQGTLSPAGSSPHYTTTTRPSEGALDSLPSSIKTTSNRTDCSPPPALLSTKLNSSTQDVKNSSSSSSSRLHAEDKNVNNTLRREASHSTLTQGHQDCTKQQQDSTTATAQSVKRAATQSKSPEFTLSLSDKLKSLTLNLQPIEVQRPASSPEPSTAQQCNSSNSSQKPTSLHIPSDAAGSISEKRKRLTLALTPVSDSLQTTPQQQQQQPEERSNKSKKRGDVCQDPACSLQLGHKGETGAAQHKSRKSLRKAEDEKERLRKVSRSRRSNSHRSSSRSITRKKDRQSQDRGVQRDVEATPGVTKYHQGPAELRGAKTERSGKGLPTPSSSTLMRGSLHKTPPSTAVEAVEGSSGEADLMSPLSLTVNKLLDWGERMLLGVLLGPRIKVAQPALPYRC